MLNSYYIDCYQGGREMSKRAEEKAVEYQIKTHGPNVMGGASMLSEEEYMRFNMNLDFKNGYEQAENDIISIIESRISEILGDAQPNPVLRIELQGIIDKIK